MDVGDVIDGKYELIRLMGEGGMGSVFEVRHQRIGRRLALKVLHPRFAENSEMVERFVREAQAAAAIGSEHIVEVTDAGETQEGEHYLVMEYLEGQTLTEILGEQGPLLPSRAGALIIQLCEGLEAAHQAGIIHRDLKPGNLVVTQRRDGSEKLKVVDFGVAKVRDALPNVANQTPELTGTSATLGTPYYMAPEQAFGSKKATQQSDIYAAGVVLYEMVTGERPFRADSYNELIVRIATEDPKPPRAIRSELESALETVILKSMARETKERYGSMAELALALAAAVGIDAPELGATRPERPAGKDENGSPRDDLDGDSARQVLALAATAADQGAEEDAPVSASTMKEIPAAAAEDSNEPDRPPSAQIERSSKVPWFRRNALLEVIGVAIILSGLILLGATVFLRESGLPGQGRSSSSGAAGDGGQGGRGRGKLVRDAGAVADGDALSLDADMDAEPDGLLDGDIACTAAMVDTSGHCCWPAQSWSQSLGECVGEPQCPTGTSWRGGACLCPEGMSFAGSESVCCWPGQSWSEDQQCVGNVRCPLGFKAQSPEECEPDEGTALGRLIIGCQQEKMASCVDLGEAYSSGRESEKSHAVFLYRQGCDDGESRGCTLLGDVLEKGRGVTKSFEKAALAFLQGCIGGEPAACSRLGLLHQKGRGVPRDLAAAAKVFRKACELGDALGCRHLAGGYFHGRGVDRDMERAAQGYEQACLAGDEESCGLAGDLYLKGTDLPRDASKGRDLLTRGCAGGDDLSCRLLER